MSKLPIVGLIFNRQYYNNIKDDNDIEVKVEDGTYYKYYWELTRQDHITSLLLKALTCNKCKRIICSDIYHRKQRIYCKGCKTYFMKKKTIQNYPINHKIGTLDINVLMQSLDKNSFNIIVNNNDSLKVLRLLFESRIKDYLNENQNCKQDKIRQQIYCKDNQLMITKLRTRLLEVFDKQLYKDRVMLLWILKHKKIKIPKQVIVKCIFPHMTLSFN